MTHGSRMRLATLFNAHGYHIAAWRHPQARLDAAFDVEHYARQLRTAERGLFDLAFLTDSLALHYGGDPAVAARFAPTNHFDPVTLLSALAPQTRHIGLVATATTSYNHPYLVARQFASLDHLSKGRAGWNLVTSANLAEAGNFGRAAHFAHDDRYARAREFAAVVTGLWDSWDEDAIRGDKAAGHYLAPDAFRPLNHDGPHFAVRGPLNIFRTPQGRPVMVQAGSSDEGRSLGAETAEVIFTAQQTLAGAREFYADMRQRMAASGRALNEMVILPGIVPFVGATRAEAQAQYDSIQALIHPEVGLRLLSELLGGIDLAGVDPDGPLPEQGATNAGKSRQKLLVDMARSEGLSVRQLYQRAAGARGHRVLIGTAADIADDLHAWFESGAADGFAVIPPVLPDSLDAFVAHVVPELQRRGLYRTSYEHATLRGHLGLPEPKRQPER